MATETAPLKKKDFKTDQDVRWCPGCGDYAILNSIQAVMAKLGRKKEDVVFVSGIGCSSRFPYYMETYGFHTIHGRAPAIASGVKIANPDLDVWLVTGDGDAMSIGGNHLIHALRRRVNLKILMFNNRIYGLTKGQYSPTSPLGKVTKTSPMGSLDTPFNPIHLALASKASFIARSIDVMGPHLQDVLMQAAQHEGSAFIEIFQNCNIFNDGAFEHVTGRDVRADQLVDLQHGQKLIFGKEKDKAIVMDGFAPKVVPLAGTDEDAILTWDMDANPALAYLLAGMEEGVMPTPIGVFRNTKRVSFDAGVHQQIKEATEKHGKGDLKSLIYAGDLWEVK